ncbi:MAG: PEP-CTERM sorting domain-containing protein [Cyanobacteria bacterium P01_D01_bin.50]
MVIRKFFSRLSIGALLATAITVAANPAQAARLTTIDFDENVGVGDNPLYGGTKLDKLWSNYGFNLDSSLKKGGKSELWLFDSNCEGNTCSGDDPDLATGKGKNGNLKYKSPEQGKVLIIQEDNGKNDLEADDYANRSNRGTITFDFTDTDKKSGEKIGVLFNSISLLDFDDPGDPIFFAKFADGTDTSDKHNDGNDGFTYDGKWFQEIDANNNDGANRRDKKLDNYFEIIDGNENETYISEMKLLSTKWNGKQYVTKDNSLREYKFDFGDKRVTEFSITLPGSGAVTGFNYVRRPEAELKFAKRVPEPTSILGLVAVSGLVASSLKRKRQSSNAEIIQ